MDSNKKINYPIIILLIIVFTCAGVFFFIQAVRMSKSFSLLDGNSKSIGNVSSVSATPTIGSQGGGNSDVSSYFQDKDPFEKSCNDNSGTGGTSVSSNTVCIK